MSTTSGNTSIDPSVEPGDAVTLDGDNLLSLLDSLRHDGFPIGVKEYITAQEVAIACSDDYGIDPTRLRNWLAPVLCTNPDEQRLFYQRFADWWVQRQPVTAIHTVEPAPVKTELDEDVQRARPWKWVALAVGLIAVAVLVPPLLKQPENITPPPVVSGTEPSQPVRPDPSVSVEQEPVGPQLLVTGEVRDIDGRVIDGATVVAVKELKGHDDHVWSINFSPDDTRVVTASRDKTARIWEAVSGRELARLAHDKWIQSAVFGPNGRRVLTASLDGTARIWDAVSGRELARLVHDGWVSSAVFGPNGRRVLTASLDGTARIWDADSGRELRRLPGTEGILSAVFSPDGKLIATNGVGAKLLHWAGSDSTGNFDLTSNLIGGTRLRVSHPDYQDASLHDIPDGFGKLTVEASLAPRPAQWLEVFIRNRELTRVTLTLLPLLVVTAWWLWRRKRRQLILERRTVRNVDALAGVAMPEPQHNLYRDESFVRARIEARRHQAGGQGDLDADATVDETVRQLGWFSPVYKTRLRLPAYLALIDRSGFRDQQAHLIDEFLDCLEEGGVTVDRYYFDRDPRMCVTAVSGDSTRRAVRELAGRYPQHRLLLFSDGSGLLDPVTGRPATWTELFSAWRERALMTPVPAFHWSSREVELARLGCSVLPATPEGLLAFVEQLDVPDSIVLPPTTHWRAPFPEIIAAHPARWLQRNEPQPEDSDELLRQLRRYLGDDSYRWLCALAVYPELDWYLTLYLGLHLQRENGTPVLDETALLSLVRLPWLRRGNMPDWLRLRLMAELSSDDENTVRGFLRELLRARLEAPGSRFRLDIAHPSDNMQRRGWTRFFSDLLRTEPDDSPLQDRVFVNFLLGKRPQRLQVLAPRNWHRWVYERGLSALGLRERTGLLLAASTSVLLAVSAFSLIDLAKAIQAGGNDSQIVQRDWQPADEQAPPQIKDVFVEKFGGGSGIRYSVRDLKLNGEGNNIRLAQGGQVKATLEINHDCRECGGAINQIIVGLAGEDRAQACVWNGGQSSRGWQTVSFTLRIPQAPGSYEVRTRYAQAYNCKDAIGWWKIDRSQGPGEQSTIGVVVVEAVSQQNDTRQTTAKQQPKASDVVATLNEKWLANVLPFYKKAIEGRYPFDLKSEKSVTLKDFGMFFGEGGIVQRFTEQELAPYLDTSGGQWRWRAEAQGFSSASLVELQRANRIRAAFFQDGGEIPLLRFSLKPSQLDKKAVRFTLEIDGQRLQYAHGPKRTTDITWPGNTRLKRALYTFEGLDGKSASVKEEGAWAWLKILDQAKISATRGQDVSRVTFSKNSLSASFDLQTSKGINPFDQDLRKFHCPQRLSSGGSSELSPPQPPTIIRSK